MATTLVGPEFIASNAISQAIAARKSVKDMRDRNHSNWTMTHGHYVTIGGIVLDIGGRRQFPIENDHMIALLDLGHIPTPSISRDEILDKSKADAFAKAATCLQAGWLVLQCIGRASQHLPLSTLELATTAFVACTLLAYIAWWEKPKDVHTPTIIRIPDVPDEDVQGWLGGNTKYAYGLPYWPKKDVILRQKVSNEQNSSEKGAGIVAVPLTVIFGGLHCLAWNFSFPSPVERLLWRVSSVSSIVAFPLLWASSVLRDKLEKYGDTGAKNGKVLSYLIDLADGLRWASLILYLVSRVYLLVESFFSLRELPEGAFETVDWSRYIPHI